MNRTDTHQHNYSLIDTEMVLECGIDSLFAAMTEDC